MVEDLLISIAKGVWMDPFSLLIMLVLCATAAYLLAQFVPSPAIMMFGFPLLTVGGLLANWGFSWLRLAVVADKYSNSVIATGLGLILSLVVIMILKAVTNWFDTIPEREDIKQAQAQHDGLR